ncbi:cellulase family glycosylhydrolase [candidate division KSB1 bacterium]|nr:cellulase family glycosylhydrolase [candidate division KSB1 bacterium]
MPRLGKLLCLRARFYALAIVLLLFFITGVGWGQSASGRFIQTDTTQFLWAGSNQYRLWFEPRQRIAQELDAMNRANLKVLRIFLDTQHESHEDPPSDYTFEDSIGTYHDKWLVEVDSLMFECHERGIKMIIALANSNGPEPYERIYGIVGKYSSQGAIDAYKKRFEHFLNHKNALLGDKAWKDINDTIWAWEIMNEPGAEEAFVNDPLSIAEKHKIIRDFLDTLATCLKKLDPDTYVALGIAGKAKYCNKASGDDIQTLGDIKNADIYTLHYYCDDVPRLVADLNYVRSIRKLFLVEEFGKLRGEGMDSLISYYRYVTRVCRENGIPWMFWRMGHRKDTTDWSIFKDDRVWQEVVIPEADSIARICTQDKWNINVKVCTNVVEERRSDAPQAFQLYPNFPNPVRLSASGKGATTISYHLPRAAPVDLRLYDLSGREIAVLLNGPHSGGTHRINWRIENRSAGLYFCRLRSKDLVQTQKLMIVQ